MARTPARKRAQSTANRGGGYGFQLSERPVLPRDRKAWESCGEDLHEDKGRIMKEARRFESESHALSALLQLKGCFLNYRLRLVPQRTGDRQVWKDWCEGNPDALDSIHEVVRCLWRDWLLLDNVVLFWREVRAGTVERVLVVPPERCEYSDVMGVEKLRMKVHLDAKDLEALPPKERARYQKGEITVGEGVGERFLVLKRERAGLGFAMPRLRGLLRTLEAQASLEVGDQLNAFLYRRVFAQWKVGHEIRVGPAAGKPTYHCKKEHATAIRNMTEGRFGIVEMVTNFDRTLEFPHPDPEVFDSTRYDGLRRRVYEFLGPLGQILHDPQAALNAWSLFRTEAMEQRQEVARAIRRVAEVLGAPVPVRPAWGSQCFQDARLALDILKHGLESGPISQRTYLEDQGFDQEEEQERKEAEAQLAGKQQTAGRVLPLFNRGTGAKQLPGRAPGQVDGGPRE